MSELVQPPPSKPSAPVLKRRKVWRGITIVDDRDVLRPLVAPPARAEWEGIGWWNSSKKLQQRGEPWITEWDVLSKAAGTYGFLGGILMIGTKALAEWLVRPLLSGAPSWAAGWILPLASGMLMWPLHPPVAWLIRRDAALKLRAAYLAARKCPSCGFDLTGLEPAHDTTTTCPECGAAWRLASTEV